MSERTATQMAISGRTLKRKPSFQVDANTALIANQSILSNGLGELDFDLSTVIDLDIKTFFFSSALVLMLFFLFQQQIYF